MLLECPVVLLECPVVHLECTVMLLECVVVHLECVVAALELVVELLGCDAGKVLAAQGVRREGVARAKEGRIPAGCEMPEQSPHAVALFLVWQYLLNKYQTRTLSQDFVL